MAWAAGSLLLFMVVLPNNHSEAEDAFEYARQVEVGQGDVLFHPHHLLYLPLQKGIYATAQLFGYEGRAYYTARAVSMTAGAVAVGLCYLIACLLQINAQSPATKWIPASAAAGLLFSYGFLRYACEVEIYVPAAALGLGAVYAAMQPSRSTACLIAGVIMASGAMLMHVINAALVLGAIPLYYWLIEKKPSKAVVHLCVTAILVTSVYAVVHFSCGLYRPPLDTASEGWFRPGTILKAAVGFGQCLLSGNFMFAYESVCRKLQALFPYRMFAEEIFTGAAMPVWLKTISPVTFFAALASLVTLAVSLMVRFFRHGDRDHHIYWLLLWLCGTALPTVVLEPSNPELWIMVLIPLWLLVAWLLSQTSDAAFVKRSMVVCICLLGAHNIIAGMGSVKSEQGDYVFSKAQWLLQETDSADVVNTADSFVFTFYLNYWGQARVRNINTQSWETGKNTYVLGDVFDPPPAIGVRYPAYASRVAHAADELRPLCRQIHADDFGGVWIIDGDKKE